MRALSPLALTEPPRRISGLATSAGIASIASRKAGSPLR